MYDQEKALFVGPCRGGPMRGMEGVSRFPKGFLLVDMGNRLVWIYEWVVKMSEFQVRNDSPMPLDDEKRERAANEAGYDVRAMPHGDFGI